MKKNIKKMLVVLLSLVMVIGLAACGNKGGSGGSKGPGDGSSITLFNSKSEIQEDFEDLAKVYEEQTGVHIDVYYSQDTVAAHLGTKYASKSPCTINMVDSKDVYGQLGQQYAADLSDARHQHHRRRDLGVYPRLLQGALQHQRDALHADDELYRDPARRLFHRRLGGAEGRRPDRHHQPVHQRGLAAPDRPVEVSAEHDRRRAFDGRDVSVSELFQARL